MTGSEPRRSHRFAKSVAPNDKIELVREVEDDATVEEVDCRIYRGAELDLHVQPQVRRDGRRFDLVDYEGKQYLDGDGDHWQFDVTEEIREGDELVVVAENVDGTYAYDFAVDLLLDREGGIKRAVSSLFGRWI